MKNVSIEKHFALLSRMMEEDFVYLSRDIGFSGACSIIGAPAAKMDKYVQDTFGVSGEELFRLYESGYESYLVNKYRGIIVNA